MKKLFLLIAILSSLSFAQFQAIGVNGQNITVSPGTNVDVIYAVSTLNQAAATYYTNWINFKDYVDIGAIDDSAKSLLKLNFKAVRDTMKCDIAIEGRFTSGDTSKAFTWVTVFNNAILGAGDSVYTLSVRPRGTFVAPLTTLTSGYAIAAGKEVIPDQIRIKLVQDAAASGGANGYMKFWLQLPRPLQKTGFKLQ